MTGGDPLRPKLAAQVLTRRLSNDQLWLVDDGFDWLGRIMIYDQACRGLADLVGLLTDRRQSRRE